VAVVQLTWIVLAIILGAAAFSAWGIMGFPSLIGNSSSSNSTTSANNVTVTKTVTETAPPYMSLILNNSNVYFGNGSASFPYGPKSVEFFVAYVNQSIYNQDITLPNGSFYIVGNISYAEIDLCGTLLSSSMGLPTPIVEHSFSQSPTPLYVLTLTAYAHLGGTPTVGMTLLDGSIFTDIGFS
jgi:hypothetical protein